MKTLSSHINQDKVIKVTDMRFHQTNGYCINGVLGSDFILGRKNKWFYTIFMLKLNKLIHVFIFTLNSQNSLLPTEVTVFSARL